MSHTKGPWIAWDTGNGMGVCPSGVVDALIPNVAAFNSEIVRLKLKDSEFTDERWEETKANAHLISAAPELLESLEQAVMHCGCSFHERQSGHKTDCPAVDWMGIIAKARGEK